MKLRLYSPVDPNFVTDHVTDRVYLRMPVDETTREYELRVGCAGCQGHAPGRCTRKSTSMGIPAVADACWADCPKELL